MNILDLSVPANQLLQERLRPFIEESTAPATRRAYRVDLVQFRAWGGTIPCTPEMVADYLAAHASRLKASTLQRRLAAISRAHDTLNLSNPVRTEVVRLTMRGIRRKFGSAQRRVRALVREDLLVVLAGMKPGLKATRDTALLLTGFCGAFRRSELVALNVEDLEWVQQGVIIHLRRSKTDQDGHGRKIGIPYGRGHVCPVQSIALLLEEATITTGPVFRPIDRHGNMAATRLTDRAVAAIIKERAKVVGLKAADLSGHSLRAGLATSAAQHGIPTHRIRQQTGHASDAMLNRYIRDGDLFISNAGALF